MKNLPAAALRVVIAALLVMLIGRFTSDGRRGGILRT